MNGAILVVDDSEHSIYATVLILKRAGFSVEQARTGREALEKANELPALILLDVNLPDLNGFEVCKQLKGQALTKRIPVLFISASSREDVAKVQGLDSGGDGYLTEPVDPSVLVATIRALLRVREAEKEAETAARHVSDVLSSITEAYVVLDREWRFRNINAAAASIFAKPAEQLIGRVLWDEFPEGKDTRFYSEFQRAIAENQPVHFEEKSPVAENWYEVHAYPRDQRLEAYLRDITDRKLLEEERKTKLEMEQKARARAEILLREVHHRVKNNLTLVSSLIRLQVPSLQDPRAVEILEDVRGQIRSIASAHDELSKHEDLQHVNLSRYIPDLVNKAFAFLNTAGKSIRLELQCAECNMDPKKAVLVGLIVNEVLTNALKYAFPNGATGKITIRVGDCGSGVIDLIISDNGIGVPEHEIVGPSSFGLRMVHMLVQQLGGKTKIEREHGTVFHFQFPAFDDNDPAS